MSRTCIAAINPTIIRKSKFEVIPLKILILSFKSLAFKKLKIVIQTKELKRRVKCLLGPTYYKIGK